MNGILVDADDGTRLHVREAGCGEPILLIAGLGGVGSFWEPVVDRLSDRYRLLAPDHRGTGGSDRPGAGYDIEVMAADMEGVARRLGLGRFAVIGHSTGGVIAQRMLLRRRAHIRAAVLSATFAKPDAHFELLFGTRLAVLEGAGPEVSARLAHLLGYDPEWLNAHAATVTAAASRTARTEDPRIAAARLRMLLAYRGEGDPAEIAVPTLVLGSEQDVIHPPYHQRELALRIPGARLRMLPGGHFFPRVNPEAFAAEVSAFLSEGR